MGKLHRIDLIVGAETVALMEELKVDFNCGSGAVGDAQLLKKALGLTKLANDQAADSNGVVLIYPKGQEDQAVALDLRN